MLNENTFIYILIIFIIILAYQIYRTTPYFHLKCIISTSNGKTYCVRDRKLSKEAVEMLSRIDDKCKKLIEYIFKKYPNDESVQRLHKNYQGVKIQETLPTSTLTAYTENKGSRMAFCLNKNTKQTSPNNEMINEDLLFFVAMHEISHVMSISVGHTEEFWENFKFILNEAKDANMYKPVNYRKKPEKYCGMVVDSNPYYN